ncbi:MAG: ISL3 family transposase, partial [Gallionella sp.]|nr:ISL3 family transposase [Gallionella sp.]
MGFELDSRVGVPGQAGKHPVHGTLTKTYRYLSFFEHECELEVRMPQVKLLGCKVMQITLPWSGKLSDFTLLFGTFVLLLTRETPFSRAARISGQSIRRVI